MEEGREGGREEGREGGRESCYKDEVMNIKDPQVTSC